MAFVHLHLHTIYSFLDGLVKPGELVSTLKEMGMTAAAITDHGNMHGVVDFYLEAMGGAKSIDDAPIKPILGMETYISADDRTKKVKRDAFHLLLLAENETGYRNLCFLNSNAWADGFYYKPRIDREILQGRTEGLIACSACLGGEIPRAIMDGDKDKAERLALEYQDLFGKGNFYFELQVNGIPEQETVNRALIDLGKKLDIPLVATNDVHYLKPEHHEAQDILFCINEKKKVTDTNRMHHEHASFYLKSEEEMRRLFEPYGDAGVEAIENTNKIAERCRVELDLFKHYLPAFDTEGMSEDDYLRKMSEDGLEERFVEDGVPEEQKDEYRKRLDYELGVIKQMGFPGYFLIVADFIQWAKKHDIPVGPGRGSGAGSLVAYTTRITDLDPLRYGLFFERFLNPERVSMPDFDVDFCQDNREKVIGYVTDKYGSKNVAQIATFGSMKAKSSVRDVARALDIDLSVADKLAKMVPEKFGDLLRPQFGKKTRDVTAMIMEKYKVPAETAKDPDRFRAAIDRLKLAEEDKDMVKGLLSAIDEFSQERRLVKENEDYSRIVKIASQIEGLLRQPGKHACGLVIGDKPIYEYSPIFVDRENYKVTQYDKGMVELVGLVKFDFLGLKTLTMLKHAETLINRNLKKGEKPFRLNEIAIDDKDTYRFLCSRSTKGVFQMESGGFEKMVHSMKPDCIEDLIAGVALYRPGPMDIIPNFIRRKHGKEPIEYDHEWLQDILNETYGLIVYQEQVMQISQAMAGFSLGKADILRRAMGKKKLKDMERMKIEFKAGAKEKGVDPEIAAKVFDHMEKFASYGFNKSHAACYGYISYQTAFLKTHYPVEFFTALISSEASDANKVLSYISDARSMGIDVFPPSVNNSVYSFSIEENAIRYGLGAIKNVGEGAIEEIINERKKNGKFKSLLDFTSRINQSKVNARTMEYLIKAGAFDFTELNRGVLLGILQTAAKEGEKHYKDKQSGQMSLFGAFAPVSESSSESEVDDGYLVESVKPREMDLFESLSIEKEVLGVYLTNHPARLFQKDMKGLGITGLKTIVSTIEDKNSYNRKKVWLGGIITTEIKPAKGRDGDYYLKGIIEDYNSAIDFAVNNVADPSSNPALEKLKSPTPLLFMAQVRALRNRDDGTLEGIRATIKDLDKDVLGFTQYIAENNEDGRICAVIELNTADVDRHMDKIGSLVQPCDGVELPLILKIHHPADKAVSFMEQKICLTDRKIAELKQAFGSEGFFVVKR